MTDKKYKKEEIKLAPPSPKLQRDGLSQWMEWSVLVPREPSKDELDSAGTVPSQGRHLSRLLQSRFDKHEGYCTAEPNR